MQKSIVLIVLVAIISWCSASYAVLWVCEKGHINVSPTRHKAAKKSEFPACSYGRCKSKKHSLLTDRFPLDADRTDPWTVEDEHLIRVEYFRQNEYNRDEFDKRSVLAELSPGYVVLKEWEYHLLASLAIFQALRDKVQPGYAEIQYRFSGMLGQFAAGEQVDAVKAFNDTKISSQGDFVEGFGSSGMQIVSPSLLRIQGYLLPVISYTENGFYYVSIGCTARRVGFLSDYIGWLQFLDDLVSKDTPLTSEPVPKLKFTSCHASGGSGSHQEEFKQWAESYGGSVQLLQTGGTPVAPHNSRAGPIPTIPVPVCSSSKQ